MKPIVLLLITTTLFLTFISSVSYGMESDHCVDQANSLVAMKYSGHKIITTQSLGDRPGKFFKDEYPNLNPGVVCTDFNNDKLYDISVLLGVGSYSETILLIFFQKESGGFEEMLRFPTEYEATYLLPKSPESIVNKLVRRGYTKEEIEKKAIRHDGVELVYYGKSASAYYWDEVNNQIQNAWTAD